MLNPVICTDLFDKLIFYDLIPFKEKISNYTDQQIQHKNIRGISVYFRDLNNGWWFGINEKELFSPASLMKVPVMIAVYKLEQSRPGTLRHVVRYEESRQNKVLGLAENKQYGSTTLIAGTAYTLDNLIEKMIMYSDNEATLLLLQYLDEFDINYLDQVNKELGLVINEGTGTYDNFLSVKQYSTFFRILYNGSYLNPHYSNKALNILSQSIYKGGIRKSIPESIKVAHKFGRRSIPINDNLQIIDQLHHFGIVYIERKPFMLGIMVKGDDEIKMQHTIEKISEMIYNEVEDQINKIPVDLLQRDIDSDNDS